MSSSTESPTRPRGSVGPARTPVALPVVIDRVACSGHGVCAALLPQQIQLDEWGYPVIVADAAAPRPSDAAAAVRLCPARALSLMGHPTLAPGGAQQPE